MNEPDITQNEWMTELEKLRESTARFKWTPEMDEALLKAREGENPIPYYAIAGFFEKRGWGKIDRKTIGDRYHKLKRGSE